jgi:hypothetical protein
LGPSWAPKLGCNCAAGRRVEGAATDFGSWAESSRGPKVEEGKGKEKGFFLFSKNIFMKRII